MSVLKFNSDDEVIERANATHFGLVAGVITKDCNKSYFNGFSSVILSFSDTCS